ncbi:hypothetical protein BV898_15786 [Hypsibius exemplaris]|uniref:Protein kinase domain-containing protein n=1 Tax=Hypsibius exemplaris TaxID=2072580 RepID=A0A9X6NIE4_HYPEX|nr:hypothetical protein BV898_15786 [Hypsibius exemplaris]
MELCDGGTLEEFLVKNPPPLSVFTILDYTKQIAHALGYLHNRSDQRQEAIFHGDLKPENVMLAGTEDNLVLKLADLDSFTRLKDKDTHRSDLKTKAGTIRYMSPEMIGNDDPDITMAIVGRATDIWSLGCIVLRMSSIDWLDCRTCDGALVKGQSLSHQRFQAVLTGGGSPDIPENMDEIVRSLVTSCLRWNPSSRLKASELAQDVAAVSTKARRNAGIILSRISTVIEPIFKALISANILSRTSLQKLRNWKPPDAMWMHDELNASRDGVNKRFMQTLSDIEFFLLSECPDLEYKLADILNFGEPVFNQTKFHEYLLRNLKLNEPFRAWLSDPNVCEAHCQFLQVYGENNSSDVVLWLKDCLTEVFYPGLVAGTRFYCLDFPVLEKNICIVLCQACSRELAYLWLTIVRCIPPVESGETASTLFHRLRNLKISVRNVLIILETARLRSQSSFLFMKSPFCNGRHTECGTVEDGLCNELSGFVYQLTKSVKDSTAIRQTLQREYPKFQWSVIVGKVSHSQKVEYDNSFVPNLMWIRRMANVGRANNDCHPRNVEYDSSFITNLMWIQRMTNLERANCKKGKVRARSLKYGELRWRTDDLDCLVLWTEAKNFEEGRNFPTKELRNFIARGGSKSPDFERWAKLNLLYYRERLCQEDRKDNKSLAKVNGITYPLTLQDHPNIYFWPVPSKYGGEVYSYE